MGDISLGAVLNAAGVIGMVAGMYWLLATGRLCTRRELTEKNAEVLFLRERNEELAAQNAALLREHGPTVTEVLAAVRTAAERSP